MDLPPSQGNTTILVIVDHFSKSCRLLPLPGLPIALQTAEALFTHVFPHYGVTEDIVSDRGPQFTSRVWKAVMERLGVSSALPQVFTREEWAGGESSPGCGEVFEVLLPGPAGGVGGIHPLGRDGSKLTPPLLH